VLSIEVVIKNANGEFLVKEPLGNLSELFSTRSQFYSKITKVIGDLKAKIKLLLEQRGVIVSESQIKLHKAISRKQINPVIFQA